MWTIDFIQHDSEVVEEKLEQSQDSRDEDEARIYKKSR